MFRSFQKFFTSSSKAQKIPKLNQQEQDQVPVSEPYGWKLFLGVTISMIIGKTILPEFRALKTMEKLSEYEPSPKPFTGIHRESSTQALSSSLKEKPVIVYAPSRSGLSSALQSFCSEQTHCLILNTRGPWAENLNELGFPVTFSFYDYRLMTLIIGKLVHKFEDLVFILDGFENLGPNQKKYLSRLVRAKGPQAGKFLVTGSDPEALREIHQIVDCNFLQLPEVTLEEMHSILIQKPGYKFDDVESLWNECGSDLEFALEMLEQGKGWDFFVNGKTKTIRKHVEEIMKSGHLREAFLAAIGSKNNFRPLGSLYFDSSLVGELKKRNLVKGLNMDTYCFRNKFVLKSIINEVQEVIKQ